jgi:predicted dehydrogenase
MRVAIFGVGRWGKNHVRAFCEILGEGSVVACDPDRARLDAARAEHPGIETCDRPHAAKDKGIDAIVVAAPAALHHALAKEALGDGFHVLVEKPMTLTAAESEELVRIADERKRILMVDHLLEYHPAVVRLKGLVEEGRLGRLLHLTGQRLNLGVIRGEENALWSLAPHDVSVILQLVGAEPIEVRAQGGTFLQEGIPDVAHLTMRFAGGALAHVHVSWLDPIKVRSLTVVGERGMAVFDDVATEKLTLFDLGARRDGVRYVPRRGGETVIDCGSEEPLQRVAESFVESIETGRSPVADGRDGLRVVRVLEAAQASLDAGGEVVRIGGEA